MGMCARVEGAPFEAELGSKNGVPAQTYRFQMVKASTTSGKYSDIMINDCKKIGMKPVCDRPSYCKTDKNAVYIGQTHHLAHGGHRGTSSYFPSGWSKIASEWDGLCAYTANHGSPKALCNHAAGSHAWQTPAQSPKFMCARVEGAPFDAELGSKNGVPARTYRFQMVKASTTTGKYSDIMINDCKKIGMKPVCDHPSYCKTDKNAVYIGQSHHLAHGGHRGTSSYFPSGWSKIASEWDGLCAYTAAHGSPKALCNHAKGSHAWQTPAQSPKFMCAKFAGGGSSGATMTLVGKGYCKDARGAEYNQYRWNHGGIPSLDKCKAACVASQGCVAITWNHQHKVYGCNLHGERGNQPAKPPGGWTATESKGNKAYGKPTSSTGWTAAECWKK